MKLSMLKLPAPAKLNAFLHVVGRRPDGYHTLESLFVPIDRCDRISLEVRGDGAIVRSKGPDSIVPEEDLVVRAARLLQRRCASSLGVAIEVDKRLPMGGGLGGGSSDAATVLLGLNRLWRLGLSRRILMEIALELGADVPFFVFGEPAFVQGAGEKLSAVSFPTTWFIVLCPPANVSTASVFSAPELTRNSESVTITVFSEGYGRNDLYAVAAARFPEIVRYRDALARGALHPEARMTGSGGCVFAAFDSEAVAQRTLLSMPRDINGFVARSLIRHPLWSFA